MASRVLERSSVRKGLAAKNGKTLAELTMSERSRQAESPAFRPRAESTAAGGRQAPPRPVSETKKTLRADPSFQPKHDTREIKHTPPANFTDSYDLPSHYCATYLTLIARDPRWIHAYWEIAPLSIDAVRGSLGGEFDRSTRVLRMYDITCVDFNGSNANSWFDIDVGRHANSWYINLWNDNVSYCAEIGMRLPDGRFFQISRSNPATTPRAGAAGRSEEIWMEVKDNASTSPFVIGEARRSSRHRDDRYGRREKERAGAARSKRKVFLSEDDIRDYYSKISPLLRDIVSQRLARKYDGRRFGGGRVIYDAKGTRIVLDDFLIRGLSRDKFLKRLLLGSSEEMVFLGASEFAAPGASESLPADKRRKFFFEIGTELIVYGRTEPDAEVWLGDKRVSLRGDGTFSLRFALPDAGKIPLDFTAISNDKVDKRRITTSAERAKTSYNP